MVYGDLEVGTRFQFGVARRMNWNPRTRQNEEIERPMQWIKTADNSFAITERDYLYLPFDYSKPASGTNRYERVHGARVYFLSALHRFLNCSDKSWREVQDGDTVPTNNSNGFLSAFNESEKQYLVPFTLETQVPSGYTKRLGSTISRSVLASIPTFRQLGSRIAEGTFGIRNDGFYTWITDVDDTACKYYIGGRDYKRMGSNDNNFNIVIKIADDAPIDVDEDNNLIIRIPEPEFEGDIATFLGLKIAA